MIGRLNHVALAVPDLARAANAYRHLLGAQLSEPKALPDHGVRVVFITLPNTVVELMEPLGEASPLLSFLSKHPQGGIHHMCYEVEDIIAARDALLAAGGRVAGAAEPKIGAHGRPVLFIHPADLCGALVELEQA